MKKIPTLFVRDFTDKKRRLTREFNPECEHLRFDSSTISTYKWDGTCVMFDGETWWHRREVKPGKPDPEFFQPVDEDAKTGKRMGWIPASTSDIAPFLEEATQGRDFEPFTYELIGPKINGNPHGLDHHKVMRHGSHWGLLDRNLDWHNYDTWVGYFAHIKEVVHEYVEGVVIWQDGKPVAKLKFKDLK
jgi:hypothetical protein